MKMLFLLYLNALRIALIFLILIIADRVKQAASRLQGIMHPPALFLFRASVPTKKKEPGKEVPFSCEKGNPLQGSLTQSAFFLYRKS